MQAHCEAVAALSQLMFLQSAGVWLGFMIPCIGLRNAIATERGNAPLLLVTAKRSENGSRLGRYLISGVCGLSHIPLCIHNVFIPFGVQHRREPRQNSGAEFAGSNTIFLIFYKTGMKNHHGRAIL